MLCGKIAAGKSTLAAELARAPKTVLVSEDAWLAALYADEMTTGADYLRCATRLRSAMSPHVMALLQTGISVVLDFPANTVESRVWMCDLITRSGTDPRMHVFDRPDSVCLDQLRQRNASGTHPFTVSELQFQRFSAYYQPPGPDEGFHLLRHGADDA